MANAIIKFTKSFTRDIKVNGVMYQIQQNEKGYLAVFDAQRCLYLYDALTHEVSYDDNLFPQIKNILHQAHVDRYAIKHANTHATDNI